MALITSDRQVCAIGLDLSTLPTDFRFEKEHLLVATAILKRHFHHDDHAQVNFRDLEAISSVELEVNPHTTLDDLLVSVCDQFADCRSTSTPAGAWVVSLDDSETSFDTSSNEVHFQFSGSENKVTVSGSGIAKADLELWTQSLAKLLVSIAKSKADALALSLDFVAESTQQEILSHSVSVSTTSDSYFSRTPSAEFTFPAQFEKQVAATPDRIAVVSTEQTSSTQPESNQQLTYAQLNATANQIAWWLIDQGIKPQSAVGVYLHRSPRMLAVLIGIQKAGCHYVPLSTDVPRERLSFMVSDASSCGCDYRKRSG